MFNLFRSDHSAFCCIEEIKLLLALNRLRLQSRVVLECMLSVLSIDMFVVLNIALYISQDSAPYLMEHVLVFEWFNILKCHFVFGTIC